MNIQRHALASTALGTQREIVSFHYGSAGEGEKVYIQASLHADELPGMLVAHHLRQRLVALEAQGSLRGEIVVVPVANPLGLAQTLLRNQLGRFDLGTGENFNRHYPAMFPDIAAHLVDLPAGDPAAITRAVRAGMHAVLDANPAGNELESMRHTLMRLACDADVVLDLHCDAEAVLHLYTGTPMWPQCEPLARYLGAHATLLATESGDCPFDEACSQTWWQLETHFKDQLPAGAMPMACLSVTVELRGQGDVDDVTAAADAGRIIDFLIHRGLIAGAAPPLPPLLHPATPLAGSEALKAPVSGVVVYRKTPGDWVSAGEPVAEIVNPLTGESHTLASSTDGVLYARENRYFATAGMGLAKVAGAVPFRTGKLLSA